MDKTYLKHFIKNKQAQIQTQNQSKPHKTQDKNNQRTPVKPKAWLLLFLAQKSVLYIYFNLGGTLQS